jgi:hypothetical protein
VDDAAEQRVAAAAGSCEQLVGVVKHLQQHRDTVAESSVSRGCAAAVPHASPHTPAAAWPRPATLLTCRMWCMFQLPRAVSLAGSMGSCTDRKNVVLFWWPPRPRRCTASKPRLDLL